MSTFLEAITSDELGFWVAGEHFAATQTMDEESSQTINYNGAFGSKKSVVRTVRPADSDTISFTALLLAPGQPVGSFGTPGYVGKWDQVNDDHGSAVDTLKGLQPGTFQVLAKRGGAGVIVYDDACWTSFRISSSTDSVTFSADFQGFAVVLGTYSDFGIHPPAA